MAEEETSENPFADAGNNGGGGDEEGGGAPEWMATFADLVTLLMCFFVLLFAMSTTQQETYKELVQSLRSALGVQQLPEAGTREGLDVPPPPDTEKSEDTGKEPEAIDEIGAMVQKELKEIESDVKELIMFNKLGGLVKVQETSEGVVITLSDVVLFATGDAAMTRRGREIMADLAQVLSQFTYPLKIAGHTDNVPIHTPMYASNWELSASRACEVVRFLIENHIDPRLLTAEGYGEFRPIAPNDDGGGRAQNRRVEIRYERYAMGRHLAKQQ